LTFEDVLLECGRNKALVAEFDRLTGHNLSMRGTPVERMVDEATGRTAEGVKDFAAFVRQFVWVGTN
jgi:hypothetical protein